MSAIIPLINKKDINHYNRGRLYNVMSMIYQFIYNLVNKKM